MGGGGRGSAVFINCAALVGEKKIEKRPPLKGSDLQTDEAQAKRKAVWSSVGLNFVPELISATERIRTALAGTRFLTMTL